jgi:hypothetical protein
MCPGRFPDVAYNCQCQYRAANEAAVEIRALREEVAQLKRYAAATFDIRAWEDERITLLRRMRKNEAERDAARIAAIEECAKVCEQIGGGENFYGCEACAAAIRGLKGKT